MPGNEGKTIDEQDPGFANWQKNKTRNAKTIQNILKQKKKVLNRRASFWLKDNEKKLQRHGSVKL